MNDVIGADAKENTGAMANLYVLFGNIQSSQHLLRKKVSGEAIFLINL